MNERYLPGGYKREQMKAEVRQIWLGLIELEKEEILSALKTVVSSWTENELEAGNNPTFEQFREFYPEWDHEPLYETIGEVMHRVKHSA
jgi:hypothetical protein